MGAEGWVCLFLFLCTCGSQDIFASVREVALDNLNEFIQEPSTKLIYFYRPGKVKNAHFLWELSRAAAHLHAHPYGVIIAKVNCEDKKTDYCFDDIITENVLVFRESKKIALHEESLPDRHSIVASLLHIDLIDKVLILKTQGERRELESKCMSQCNMLIMYVPFLGGYEHRVFMEIAHSILDKYLCLLTTVTSVVDDLIKPPSAEDDSADAARESSVWVLHCKTNDENHRCPQSLHRGPVDLINIGKFVSALQLPAWGAARRNGDQLETIYNEPGLDLPVAYVIYDDGNNDVAVHSAGQLGIVFRGSVGIATIHSKDVTNRMKRQWKVEDEQIQPPSVVFKDGKEAVFVFNDYQNGAEFIKEYLDDKKKMAQAQLHDLKVANCEDDIPQLIQDDFVSLRVKTLGTADPKIIPSLNDISMSELMDSGLERAAILFYNSWEVQSQLILHMLNNIALTNENIKMFKVDCYDWTDVCQMHNVSVLPVLRVYGDNQHVTYRGVVNEPLLLNFLKLSFMNTPVILSCPNELNNFLQGAKPNRNAFVAGLPNNSSERVIFETIARQYHGLYLLGLCVEGCFSHLSKTMSLDKQFVASYNPNNKQIQAKIQNFDEFELRKFIEMESMPKFPELTIETFPGLKKRGDFIALLISENIEKSDQFLTLIKLAPNVNISIAWSDSQSEIGSYIVKHYNLEEGPQLMAFKDEIDVYKYNGTWTESDIADWMDRVTNGTIKTSITKNIKKWGPVQPDFDFLEKIDLDEEGIEKIQPECEITEFFNQESIKVEEPRNIGLKHEEL